MKLTTWLSRAFPLERRPAAGGLLSGFLLAVVLWLPLPEAVSIPAWLPPVLLLAALAVLLVLYAAGRPLLASPHVLGWRGLGLAAAGLLLPLVPLGGADGVASGGVPGGGPAADRNSPDQNMENRPHRQRLLSAGGPSARLREGRSARGSPSHAGSQPGDLPADRLRCLAGGVDFDGVQRPVQGQPRQSPRQGLLGADAPADVRGQPPPQALPVRRQGDAARRPRPGVQPGEDGVNDLLPVNG